MPAPELALDPPAPRSELNRSARLRAMALENFQFIWRSLRRLGVGEPTTDDATQQVFEIAARRLDEIEVGKERAFLFKTAVRVAMERRRQVARARETLDELTLQDARDPGPTPEQALEWQRSRALLDAVLDAMPLELRTVFVLFELEGLSSVQIAPLLDVPVGTVASRLRRAREEFSAQAKRIRARQTFGGGLR